MPDGSADAHPDRSCPATIPDGRPGAAGAGAVRARAETISTVRCDTLLSPTVRNRRSRYGISDSTGTAYSTRSSHTSTGPGTRTCPPTGTIALTFTAWVFTHGA